MTSKLTSEILEAFLNVCNRLFDEDDESISKDLAVGMSQIKELARLVHVFDKNGLGKRDINDLLGEIMENGDFASFISVSYRVIVNANDIA